MLSDSWEKCKVFTFTVIIEDMVIRWFHKVIGLHATTCLCVCVCGCEGQEWGLEQRCTAEIFKAAEWRHSGNFSFSGQNRALWSSVGLWSHNIMVQTGVCTAGAVRKTFQGCLQRLVYVTPFHKFFILSFFKSVWLLVAENNQWWYLLTECQEPRWNTF